MRPAPLSIAQSDPISRLVSSDSPVLIFEVGAAGSVQASAPSRRREVRLIGSVRDGSHDAQLRGRNDNLAAVVILRALTPARLLSCVRALTYGGAALPTMLLSQTLLYDGANSEEVADRELTDREFDVLRLLADGDSTRDIAQRLSYSERTVKNIVHDLLAKLNCRTRAHAVALAARQGVI